MTDIVGAAGDVLTTDDDVRPLRAHVALVAVQRYGFGVYFDLGFWETEFRERRDQGLRTAELSRTLHSVRHGLALLRRTGEPMNRARPTTQLDDMGKMKG